MVVKVDIVGDNSGLLAALNASKVAVSEAAEQMSASFERVSGAFERIQTAMVAVTALFAGGKAFGDAVNASQQAALGADVLSKQLGITASQASVLKVAMDEQSVSSEAVSGASNKIATTLKKNENAFAELGVATRDANGNFRDSFSIMQDVNAKLGEFKEGTDRNVEGMKIYGKSWQDIAPSIRITAKAMEEAAVTAKALGLFVGVEGIAQATAYRSAMARVHTAFDGIEKAIGDALIPSLTKLGEWFASVGPKAVEVTKGAIVALAAVYQKLTAAGSTFIEIQKGMWVELVTLVGTFVEVINRALHFDFAGAKAAWKAGLQSMEDEAKKRAANIKQAWTDAANVVDALGERLAKQDTPTDAKTGAASSGGDGREKSQMAALEAKLAAFKANFSAQLAAQGQFSELSKAEEVDYWKAVLNTANLSAADKIAVERKIADETVAIKKAAFDGELARLKNEEAEARNNMTARLAIETEYAAKVKTAYGADSKEYAQAQAAILATKRGTVEQERQLDDIRSGMARANALNDIATAENAAKIDYDQKRITFAQLTALEEQFEAQKYAIRVQALAQQEKLIDPDRDPVKYAEISAQIEQLASSHEAAMVKIKQAADAQQVSLSKNVWTSLQQGFATAFQGIINGTMSLGQAFKSVFTSMLSTFVSTIAQIGATRLTDHLIAMTQNKTEALSNSGVAATGAAKSAASIPYVGWAIAIGAAAAVFAAASSYSAAGGFDVPSGINPVTQLHSKEMVLPAPLAERVRGMTDTGDTNGTSSAGPVHVHFPGARMGNFFMIHRDDMHAAIKSLVRDGHLTMS